MSRAITAALDAFESGWENGWVVYKAEERLAAARDEYAGLLAELDELRAVQVAADSLANYATGFFDEKINPNAVAGRQYVEAYRAARAKVQSVKTPEVCCCCGEAIVTGVHLHRDGIFCGDCVPDPDPDEVQL